MACRRFTSFAEKPLTPSRLPPDLFPMDRLRSDLARLVLSAECRAGSD